MKRAIAAGLMTVLGPGAAAAGGPALTGFHDLAARGELVEVRRPLFMDGTLRVGRAVGKVRRRALGRRIAVASPASTTSRCVATERSAST